ncbi:tyrosine-type recombinase/integrase [Serratia rubidaea]|uniref:tyrosine-type recombinase/integrase n=1 Tax=Serratia rubidaea TaxID=61652 RepID=UPI001BB0ACFC|nr:tyrosine-type recombinase/integrase [Serratia rubidaea]
MDLALVTGQRRADIAKMRFEHVVNGRLLIEQDKTGAMIALPLSLELQAVSLQLGAVIDRCRQVSKTDYMISPGIRKNSPDGAISLNGLSGKFAIARKLTGLEFKASPPPFHEIRSLSGRLYEKEKGKDFAQKLLGLKSGVMTEKYLDARRKEYVML